MNETIKNPSLIPDWFITSGGKVTGIHDANGKEYQFVGASEKGEDGKTPDLRINSANGFKWESRYYPDDWNEIPGSPAASGMVGPQGETGPSGNSIVLQSAVPADGGVKVTLAWGENETSAFVIPSGAPGSSITAGTDLILDSGVMKVNTNGVANETGMAFVEGVDTVASGAASHAEGKLTSAFSPYSHIEGYKNGDNLIPGLIGANHTEGAYNQTSGVYAHVEGHANKLYGYGVHMQGGYNEFTIRNTSADRSDPEGRWNIWGISIEGMANKTTSEPVSGHDGSTPLYTHGGILKVIGNGTRTGGDEGATEQIDRSDALILYRDGSMWVQGPISANGVELGNYTPTLPLNIGSNNTVTDDSIGAIGNNCQVGKKSIALSYLGASAYQNSMAVGDGNYASANSLAMGWGVTAKQYGVIFGKGNSSNPSEANNYSIAAGDAVFAYNYSQAFGRGLVASGNANGKGLMAIGGWNKTQSNALFVIGNGTNSDDAHRSDAFVVYSNSSVKEGNTNTVASNNTHIEGTNNTDTGVTTTSFTPGSNHIEGGFNTSNGGLYNHVEGEANHVWGDRVHMEGNRNIYSAADYEWGVSIEGMACATSANTPNVHGGILKVIGNGTRGSGDAVTRSDALRLYRDGSLWIQGDLNATKIANANGTDTVGAFSGINNVQVYPAGTSTSNFPDDGVLRIVLES